MTEKPKGLAKIWREIKRPFRQFGKCSQIRLGREIIFDANDDIPLLPDYGWFSKNARTFTQVRLELTNICAYRCKCCSRDFKRPLGIMSMEDLALTLETVKGHKGEIHLHGHGDCIHLKDFPEKIRLVRYYCPDAFIFINTTLGYNISEEFLDSIVQSGLNAMAVSFYGDSSATYKLIHGVDNFDLVKNNLLLLNSVKKRHATFNFNVKRFSEESYRLVANDYCSSLEERGNIQKFFKDNNIVYFFQSLHNYGGSHSYLEIDQSKPCSIAWGQYYGILQIQWNLDVVPCTRCADNTLVFGNLKNYTLDEIFTSSFYKQYIKDILCGNVNEYSPCNVCERNVIGSDTEKKQLLDYLENVG